MIKVITTMTMRETRAIELRRQASRKKTVIKLAKLRLEVVKKHTPVSMVQVAK